MSDYKEIILKKSKYYLLPDPLNVFRVVALLSVYLLHATLFDPFPASSKFSPYYFYLFPSAWGGVFLFFLLSGYLAGKSFAAGRYAGVEGAFSYYYRRVTRILLPTWGFLIFVGVFLQADFFVNYPEQILAILTLTYNGALGVDGVGVTWYVFTLMWLYFLTPLFHLVLDFLRRHGGKIALLGLLVVLILAGAVFRYTNSLEEDRELLWYAEVYTPVWGNLDFYLAGMLLPYLALDTGKKPVWMKALGGILLGVLVLWNARLNYFELVDVCRYYIPSLYIPVALFYFYAFDVGETRREARHSPIDFLAGISFEFYLIHSLVLRSIASCLPEGDALVFHYRLLVISFLFTVLFSCGMHRIFADGNSGKFSLLGANSR